ncbi:hypothetical protein [Saccharopolyspora phatthalungensis]|uniref:Uncharacterized protein n=1 Tax=Saccharopolyspora phatthalungensis TaxID=664693 RepID=A0A840QBD4_9PSEU|nr:hypothetical protein [Saccharopolyspora phatthalungensis]MBB5157101.1 hypothetical protein [Saccharopolyspora phatthalungensis]
MAKNKKSRKTITDADEALARARAAAPQLKPNAEALYWATMAQVLLLSEVRDMMREARTDHGSSVQLPEQAPPREKARVTVVNEP